MCVREAWKFKLFQICQRIWIQAVLLTVECVSCFLLTVLIEGFAAVVWVSVAVSCWLVMEVRARLLVWEAGSASSLLPCFFACRCSPKFSCPRIVSRNTRKSAMVVGSNALVTMTSVNFACSVKNPTLRAVCGSRAGVWLRVWPSANNSANRRFIKPLASLSWVGHLPYFLTLAQLKSSNLAPISQI